MCHILKLLGQLLHGQLGLGLTLQLGEFPQNLAATEGTEHRLTRLQERARRPEAGFLSRKMFAERRLTISQKKEAISLRFCRMAQMKREAQG